MIEEVAISAIFKKSIHWINSAKKRDFLQFAARFGFPVATLRHWERGNRKPRGPSLVLLNVIARNPKAVMQALSRTPAPK